MLEPISTNALDTVTGGIVKPGKLALPPRPVRRGTQKRDNDDVVVRYDPFGAYIGL